MREWVSYGKFQNGRCSPVQILVLTLYIFIYFALFILGLFNNDLNSWAYRPHVNNEFMTVPVATRWRHFITELLICGLPDDEAADARTPTTLEILSL
jgi:hypothetical protein